MPFYTIPRPLPSFRSRYCRTAQSYCLYCSDSSCLNTLLICLQRCLFAGRSAAKTRQMCVFILEYRLCTNAPDALHCSLSSDGGCTCLERPCLCSTTGFRRKYVKCHCRESAPKSVHAYVTELLKSVSQSVQVERVRGGEAVEGRRA